MKTEIMDAPLLVANVVDDLFSLKNPTRANLTGGMINTS